MSYTEQALNAIREAHDFTFDGDMVGVRRALSHAMRTLEAMEREPLEDVIDDLSPGTKISHVWPLREGGYEAEIGVPVRQDPDGWWDHERFRGEGATIDAAIRNAVAAAKGGKV